MEKENMKVDDDLFMQSEELSITNYTLTINNY